MTTQALTVTSAPSPNHDARDAAIDMIIVHYTGMESGRAALQRLRDPAAKVSAHYLVEENGEIYRLVDEAERAWHAGVSSWRGESNINARSIGVEIVNPGHEFGYRDFPEAQIDAALALLADIGARQAIAPTMVLGHSDVAPERKEDPGERFPWARLAAAGLAIGPFQGGSDPSIAYDDALAALSRIGYGVSPGGHAAALLAFQRRFCPAALGQGFNGLTKAALMATAAAFDAAA